MSDAERTALLAARERLRGALAALDALLGQGEVSCPEGGAHQFQLLDARYGVYVCAACGAQEIREG